MPTQIAKRKGKEPGKDHYEYNFYNGKMLSARYYLRNLAPNIRAVEELVKDGDASVIEAYPEVFDY